MRFTPHTLGPLTLPHRLVMPPLTRSRAKAGNEPTALMAQYYAQRVSAGRIVREVTPIRPQGQSYAWPQASIGPCSSPAGSRPSMRCRPRGRAPGPADPPQRQRGYPPQATDLATAKVVAELDVAYLHIANVDWADAPQMPLAFNNAIRLSFPTTLIYAGLYDAAKAQAALDAGWADLIGMGRAFIANPDLPHRLQHGLALNALDSATLFGGGAQGTTDYPSAG